MICKTGDTRSMAIQYDEMGYAIGDDGIYPMDHVMAHAPSMPMQPSGSDVPYVVSAIPPPAASPPPSAPPRPQAPPPSQSYLERMSAPIQAAMTNMPGSAFVQGVAPLVNFPFQVAGSALYGLGKQIVSPETADFNKDTTEAMRATNYTPPSKAGSDYQEALMRAIEVSKLPPYLGHMPPARFSGSDARVLAKQNIERAREVSRITEDFRNAQSGITRESNLGGKTYGENLQAVASDIGDVAARQAARRNEYAPAMPGSVQVFSDLVPDTRKYMMQGPNSALWDKDSVARAAELEATGKTDKEIHYLTGTSRAGDNFQRQELSDVGSLVNPGFFELYKTHPQAIGKLTHQLPDVYEHPSIYTAYPQLRKVNVQVANLGKASAQYDDVNKILVLDSGIINNPQLVKEAIEHEMMHEIQVIEGFEKGGNSEMFPPKKVVETAQFLEKLMDQYGVSAADAAKIYKKQLLLPRKVDPQAIRYANEMQGNLMPDTDPVARYQHIHGEIEAETPLGRSDLEQNQLQRFYPWAKDPKDVEGILPQFTPDPYGRPRGRGAPIGVNPENALYRSTRNAKGEHVFSKQPKFLLPIKSTTPVSQMKSELQMSENKPVDSTKRNLIGLGLKSKDQLPTEASALNLNDPSSIDATTQAIVNMPMTRRKLLTTAGNAVLSHAGRGILSKAIKIPTFESNPVIDQGLQARTLDYFNYDMNSTSPVAYLTAIYKDMRKNLTDRVSISELKPYDAIQADLRSELSKLKRKGIEEDEVDLTTEQLEKIDKLANFVRDKVPLLKPHEHVTAVKALRPYEDESHTDVGVYDDLSNSKVLVDQEELAKYLKSSKSSAIKPEIQQSVKEKGGNWPESWVDTNILRLQHKIPEFDPSKSFTQEQGNYIRHNYPDVATDYDIFYNETKQHHMRYGDDMWQWLASSEPKLYNDLVNKTTSNHVLNQWVEKRLRPYLKNDLATPTDPVRKLADEHGISHIKDLENTQSMSKFALEEARERNKMPLEGHATTQAGRMWENLADTSVHPMPGREFLGDYTATATRQPELYEAVRKDPTTKIHQLGSDFDTRLGLDHLMDELRSSLTGNVPPHLALTPKTLERMTMVDAIRHVSKVNDYREKQMAKTAAEDMKDFPPIRVYENGDKWHDLKLPALSEKAAQELKNDPLFGIPEQVRGSWDRNIARDLEARGFDDPESDDYMHAYITREQELAQDYYSRNPQTHKEAYTKLEKILKNEGDLMGHCVGSYCNEVSSGEVKILTLRDKNNKPHVTVEFNRVLPRYEDLPDEVKAMSGTEQDQWIQDNPTVALNQVKGKANKPVVGAYQAQVLDLLNNPEGIYRIYEINSEGRHDLTSADIIDRDDTKSVMNALLSKLSSLDNRLDRYHDMLQQNPDLPRFISTDALAALMKTSLGNKRGGLIHMNDGGKVQPISPSPSVNDQSKPVTPIKTIINPDAPEFKDIFIRERANRVGGSGGGGGSGGADLKQIMNPRAHATGGGVNIDTMRYALLRKKHG